MGVQFSLIFLHHEEHEGHEGKTKARIFGFSKCFMSFFVFFVVGCIFRFQFRL